MTRNVGCAVLLISHTLGGVEETPSIMFHSEIWLQSKIWISFWISRRLTLGMTTTRVWSSQCRLRHTSCVVTKSVFAAGSYWSVSQSIFNSNFYFKNRFWQPFSFVAGCSYCILFLWEMLNFLALCSCDRASGAKREERIPTRCNKINDLLSILDVDYWLLSRHVSGIFMPIIRRKDHVLLHMGFSWYFGRGWLRCCVVGCEHCEGCCWAATFTVLTPHNVAPQHRNQPHPTLPAKTHIQ